MRAISLVGCVSLFVAAFATFGTASCKAEEDPPNPPATRNGTEDTDPPPHASLPAPSDPTVGQGTSSSSSSSSSSGASSSSSGGTSSSSSSSSSGGSSSSSGTTPTLPNGPTSGVDETKKLSDLSTMEKQELCDWSAGILGGYNHTTTCSGGTSVTGPTSQSSCVAKLPPTCAATVSDVEACFKVDAKDPCAYAILTAPECQPLRDCSM